MVVTMASLPVDGANLFKEFGDAWSSTRVVKGKPCVGRKGKSAGQQILSGWQNNEQGDEVCDPNASTSNAKPAAQGGQGKRKNS